MITAYDCVAVGEALAAARIVEPAGNVRVVHAPNDLPFGVELNRLVAVREIDNCTSGGPGQEDPVGVSFLRGFHKC